MAVPDVLFRYKDIKEFSAGYRNTHAFKITQINGVLVWYGVKGIWFATTTAWVSNFIGYLNYTSRSFTVFVLKSDKFSCIFIMAKYSACYEDESEKMFYLTVEILMYCLANTVFLMWSPPQSITMTSLPKSTEETTFCRSRMFSAKQFFEGTFPSRQNSLMIPILSYINPFHNHERYFR